MKDQITIKLSHWRKPIPARDGDWCAVDDDTYDVGSPIGWGATALEAVSDLLDKIGDGT